MSQKIIIDGSRENQTQIALLSDNNLEDFEFESNSRKNLKGNIYLGKVSRIEASLQAAFVDFGSEKNGFLAFGEIHPNYFQIPVADREALIAAEAEAEETHNDMPISEGNEPTGDSEIIHEVKKEEEKSEDIDEKIINPPIIVQISGISSKIRKPNNDAINNREKFTGCKTERSVNL